MPICTSCTTPVPFLYTLYQSAYNLRLEQCPSCHAFADPYVEHDNLTLLLDLILLKRDVYRHLIYNVGAEPQRLTDGGDQDEKQKGTPNTSRSSWRTLTQVGLLLVLIDAFIRFTHAYPVTSLAPRRQPFTFGTITTFSRFFLACLGETFVFHTSIILGSVIVLYCTRQFHRYIVRRPSSKSGTRKFFRLSHIPLTLFYSSFTKLFLLLLLSIWDSPAPSPTTDSNTSNNHNGILHTSPLVQSALQLFDEDRLDREWVVRNVIGGMAAGFGLRVVMDCHPIFITMIIIFGWALKTLVADIFSAWVITGSGTARENWLASSIP